MLGVTSPLELRQPRSLKDALAIRGDERVTPLAGCTDVFVEINAGRDVPKRYLNLWGIQALRRIDERRDVLVLGALTTYTDLIRSPIVQRRLPMLVEAARTVGGAQIQNRGTIGGNIANASPAGDTLPVLAAADATVVLRSATDTRRVPFQRFYTGYRRSVMRRDELLVAVEVPRVDGVQWFRKVGTRAAQAISKVVVAGVRNDAPRVAVGSVAPTVVRLKKTERTLAAGNPIEDAMAAARDEITPIDDVRSTARYRTEVTANLVRRFWIDTAR